MRRRVAGSSSRTALNDGPYGYALTEEARELTRAAEPHRGTVLEADLSPSFLLAGVCGALGKALEQKDVRFARERAEGQPNDYRAVVQFGLGAALYDWFFNGRMGYRAHFRAHYECGLKFNSQLIDALR